MGLIIVIIKSFGHTRMRSHRKFDFSFRTYSYKPSLLYTDSFFEKNVDISLTARMMPIRFIICHDIFRIEYGNVYSDQYCVTLFIWMLCLFAGFVLFISFCCSAVCRNSNSYCYQLCALWMCLAATTVGHWRNVDYNLHNGHKIFCSVRIE